MVSEWSRGHDWVLMVAPCVRFNVDPELPSGFQIAVSCRDRFASCCMEHLTIVVIVADGSEVVFHPIFRLSFDQQELPTRKLLPGLTDR